MFDLNQAITEWRAQMAAAGILNPETLNELESHLREDFERRRQSGEAAPEAFAAAARQLGQARVLQAEFAKESRSQATPLRKHLKVLAAACVLMLLGLAGYLALPQGMLTMSESRFALWALASILPAVGAGYVAFWLVSSMRHRSGPRLDFTVDADRALELARVEARQLGHDFVGTEHLLLGLLHAESGLVREVMAGAGVRTEIVRTEVAKIATPQPPKPERANLPFTPRALQSLSLAAAEAASLHHHHVSPAHLLLGLLREGHGVAGLVLRQLGFDARQMQARLRNAM